MRKPRRTFLKQLPVAIGAGLAAPAALDAMWSGIKDLFSARGVPTTWGAKPYERQVFD